MPTYTKRRTTNKRSNNGPWGGTRYTTTKSTRQYGQSQTTTRPTAATGYQTYAYNFCAKMNSWKTLYNQTRGPAKYNRPTPTTLNTFANWVTKGAIVHTVSPTQVSRWARNWSQQFNPNSLTSCKNFLWWKYGKQTIKAVSWAKNGWFMIATSQTWNGKPFNWPRC